MRFPNRIQSALGMLLLGACSDGPGPTTPAPLPVQGGARLLPLSGVLFRLGSSDQQAAPEESPGWTRFRHDVWMDTTEVTQADFAALMGNDPSPSSAPGGTMPVVNVTQFDAILYCNARSKRDHLDTVYDYTALQTDASGACLNASGLAVHLDRNGWRLPTEAEWEAAARAGRTTAYLWGDLRDSSMAADYAWYQANSGARLHPVATRRSNPWGLYDLAGNAMEWVQDWKDGFPVDTLDDFAGPEAPLDVPEVPLKGGAYNYDLPHLRPSSRTATYAAYRSAKAEYVGFRCARGGFSASYSVPGGRSVQAPPVNILCPGLARLLGAQSARLVFLNRSGGRGLLSWIDFGETSPVVRSLPDTEPIFHPAISPDGQWVAWSTTMEGSTQAGRIKVRRLTRTGSAAVDLGPGAIPRWWTDGTDTFLVRASAMDNTSSDWAPSTTTARRWSGGVLTGTAETWARGSYHDGRSGAYLYTGFRRLRQWNLDAGTDRVLFTAPSNGKGPGDTSQVCNASAAPDGSGRVLFLDFGYSGTSALVGRSYGQHQVAFLADSLGSVLRTFPVPSGKLRWDHLEWSSHPDWAVGIALEQNESYKEIHLLGLADSSLTPIASGQDLWMPDLWVGAASVRSIEIDPDSAARYQVKLGTVPLNSLGDSQLHELANRLALFWMEHRSIELAMVGSSRVGAGIAKSEFHTGQMINWGMSGSHTYEDVQLVRNYLLPSAPRLKAVGLSLMPAWFLEETGEDLFLQMTNSVGYKYDADHGFWRDSLPAPFLAANASLAPSDSAGMNAAYGDWHLSAAGWGGAGGTLALAASDELEAQRPAFASNMKLVRDLAREFERQGKVLFMAVFPQHPGYKQTRYADFYGPTWPVYREVLDSVRSLEGEFGCFHLYDADLDGNHDYDSLDFNNESHLSYLGAAKFSHRLDSAIAVWIGASR